MEILKLSLFDTAFLNAGNEPYPYIYRHDWEPQIAYLNTLGDTLLVIYTAHRLTQIVPIRLHNLFSPNSCFCQRFFVYKSCACQHKSLGVTSCTSYKVPLASFNHSYNSMFRACNMLQPQFFTQFIFSHLKRLVSHNSNLQPAAGHKATEGALVPVPSDQPVREIPVESRWRSSRCLRHRRAKAIPPEWLVLLSRAHP